MEIDYNLLLDHFRLYLLVFVRITALVVSAPVLGSALVRVAPQLIAGLGGALTLVVMMTLETQTVLPPLGWEFAFLVAGEVFIGLSIGFVASVILAGIQVGGEIIDHLIGFAVVDVIDPVTNESASLVGNLKGLLATVLFLLLKGHLMLFRALTRTFELVPPGSMGLSRMFARAENSREFLVWDFVQNYTEALFVVGIQVAAPCLLVMTILWIPEGFLARMIPQLNLLVNDIPMRIMLGLFTVWLGFGPFIKLTERLIENIGFATDRFAVVLAGV